MLKDPIFCNPDSYTVSNYYPLLYRKLRDDIERQTLNAGFERPFGPRVFRRGAVDAVNGAFN